MATKTKRKSAVRKPPVRKSLARKPRKKATPPTYKVRAIAFFHEHHKAIYVNALRIGVAVVLIVIASGDHWDHIHNFLLGYHIHVLHAGWLGSD